MVVETRTRTTSPYPIVSHAAWALCHSHPGPPPSLTSCSLCTSLEGNVGGKWSRKACCFSCRKEGANLWDEHGRAGWGDPSAKSQPQIHWVAGRGMVISPQGTFALL